MRDEGGYLVVNYGIEIAIKYSRKEAA